MTDKSFVERFAKKSNFTSSAIAPSNPEDNTTNPQPQNSSNSFQDAVGSSAARKPIDPQKRALAQFIYLVKGVDAGRNAWYYVLVERLKVQLFLKALNDDIIHLENYGKILYSAYGDEPPAHITQAIKDEYGIE